jgi:catechol 2,3-dioxygenase-like lactoylglutathione lyase family enzyme
MDHAGIVVEDLAAAIAFFTELGLELVGETTVGGQTVDRVIGLEGTRGRVPTRPARACPVCRRAGCTDESHQRRIDDWRARRARRPYDHAERRYTEVRVRRPGC